MSSLLHYTLSYTHPNDRELVFRLAKRPKSSRHPNYNGRHSRNYLAELIVVPGDPAYLTESLDPAIHASGYEFPPPILALNIAMPFRDWFQHYHKGPHHPLPDYINGPRPTANDYYNHAISESVWDPERNVYVRTRNYQGYRTGVMPDGRTTNGWYNNWGYDHPQEPRHDNVFDTRTGRWHSQPVGNQYYGTAHDYGRSQQYGYGDPYHGGNNGQYYGNEHFPSWNQGNVYVPIDHQATYGNGRNVRAWVNKVAGLFVPKDDRRYGIKYGY